MYVQLCRIKMDLNFGDTSTGTLCITNEQVITNFKESDSPIIPTRLSRTDPCCANLTA